MLRYKTEIALFSCLVRHPARKRSRTILTTLEPARALIVNEMYKSKQEHSGWGCKPPARQLISQAL